MAMTLPEFILRLGSHYHQWREPGILPRPSVTYFRRWGAGCHCTSILAPLKSRVDESLVGQVAYVEITNAGSGYTSIPTVTFNNTGTGGSGAAATTINPTINGGAIRGYDFTNNVIFRSRHKLHQLSLWQPVASD